MEVIWREHYPAISMPEQMEYRLDFKDSRTAMRRNWADIGTAYD